MLHIWQTKSTQSSLEKYQYKGFYKNWHKCKPNVMEAWLKLEVGLKCDQNQETIRNVLLYFFPTYISIMEKGTEKNLNASVLILESGPTFH